MYSFSSDYSEGAHPSILKAMAGSNMEQTEGYGLDKYSLAAADCIKKRISCKDVDIHFIPGGTQTNLIAISSFLKPHEAVISALSGHIETHEAGAIESSGHKILGIETKTGKICPGDIKPVLEFHTDEHMVKPRLVYISNTTELGTVYNKKELEALSVFCRQNELLLYMDGARLGPALCCEGCELKFNDIAELCDAFYIGGTKNGALLGEALVICSDALKEDFRYYIKQKGALFAKGRILGIQFYELLSGDLFFELARHANETAGILRAAIVNEGFPFLSDSPSNQIFPILPDALVQKLHNEYQFYIWSKTDPHHACIRLVTSWATPKEEALNFARRFKELCSK